MRTFAIVSALTLFVFARASFDLVLVTDRTQGVVHRYDGDTGVYLGSFGNGQLAGARGIDVDQDRQIAAIACDGPTIGTKGLVFYNYFTGEHLGGWYGIAGSDVERLPDGSFAMSTRHTFTTKVHRFSYVMPGVIAENAIYSSGSESPYGAIGLTNMGEMLAVRSGSLARWGYSGGGIAGSLNNAQITGPIMGAADFSSKHLIWGMRGDGAVLRIEQTGAVSYTGATSSISLGVDFALAHQNFGYGLGTTSSITRLQKFQYFGTPASGGMEGVGTGWNISQVSSPGGIAVVIAPEPSIICAFSAGVLMLLRRKKA